MMQPAMTRMTSGAALERTVAAMDDMGASRGTNRDFSRKGGSGGNAFA
jgi:hypothetical protein